MILLLPLFVFVLLLYVWRERKKFKNYPPGPTGVPFFGYLPFLGAEPHKTLLQLSKKYKSSLIGVKLGSKYTIILNDFDTMKEVVCHPSALNRAPNLFDHIPEVGFITRNGEEWQEQRRFCMQSTRDLGLGRGAWENMVQDEVQEFLKDLALSKGEPIEVSHKLNCAICNNILALLIGRRMQRGKEDDKINLLVDYSDVSFTYMGPSNPTTLMPSLRKIFQYFKIAGYDRAAKIIADFRELVREETEKHKKDSEYSDVVDFINMYLGRLEEKVTNKAKSHYFSEKMLEGNVKILFLGASDTIFSSLGWLLYLMASKPEVQRKVQEELDEVLGTDGIPSYYERSKIPYTFAVLMESQRYSSIVPLSTTRSASADFEVRGYTIPKGAEIISNLWALHNDPKYWSEPEKFIPERFLTSDSKLLKTPPSYVPFSLGRRNCPGETVAWMEILAFFASVLRKFSVQAPPGVELKCEVINGLVAHLKPQPLCFVEREQKNSF